MIAFPISKAQLGEWVCDAIQKGTFISEKHHFDFPFDPDKYGGRQSKFNEYYTDGRIIGQAFASKAYTASAFALENEANSCSLIVVDLDDPTGPEFCGFCKVNASGSEYEMYELLCVVSGDRSGIHGYTESWAMMNFKVDTDKFKFLGLVE